MLTTYNIYKLERDESNEVKMTYIRGFYIENAAIDYIDELEGGYEYTILKVYS